ncbi:hypothetical protein HDV01_005758 [Terramyces sp. JEL0728]|nr:hypothetical protein HDV01_005758 [Terramyces sp. JEL0728]
MASKKVRKAQEDLEKYYQEVTRIILARQNAASGLIPASVAITTHGDYRDAWVRDNVYSILAVWGLGLAYRRLDDDQGRAYELEHATIKCMRGLLFAMMRQAAKVEKFKGTQALDQALHAKYNTQTGDTVVGDNQWGHLQIDATSIFLLMLAQMTVSGLHIIYTTDEVQFIQNLVFYIERGYRTPDYGIWERGNKMNHGEPELNCSSIGMVVAALQAINGVNLFGSRGGSSSVIHVLPDEIARNYTTLHSALPRESPSKEIDAALLAVISFPAFAIGDAELTELTRKNIIKKLGGTYGCKRFLRDGHQTVLEDHNRLYYEPHELKIFENVESEWPLFFTYLILDGIFNNNHEQVEHYRKLMDALLVDSNSLAMKTKVEEGNEDEEPEYNMRLVPELYIVPKELIEEERANPGSQERVPNQNIPLVWAQSLYILGNLIYDNYLSVADIDPLGRRFSSLHSVNASDTMVQIVLLSESKELQSKLLTYGLETYIKENCSPISISKPSCLRDAYALLGANEKLGLSGRPDRPMGSLSTCKIYRCQGQLYAFLPHFMDREEFYIVSDNNYLVSLFEQEISSVRNLWMSNGRPTMVVMLTHQMVGNMDYDERDNGKKNLLNFLISIGSSGICNGTRVRVGRLSEMINTACIESLDFLVNRSVDAKEDWDEILREHTVEEVAQQKLKINTTGTSKSPIRGEGIPSRNRSIIDATSLKSPLAKSLGYQPDAEELTLVDEELKDENILGPSMRSDSPVHDDGDHAQPVSLTLGNPDQTPQAIDMLFSCSNLYDQIDLLHYLYSCHGGSFVVPGLASLDVLLDEVYWKAMHSKLWSVVRQAAGILRKTVNSLTSNLADLLIRQKPVTIGLRPKEYFINTPKNPSALSQIIYDNCTSDIREAPLIQEIITYLGSLVRGSPGVFSGIMRIRIHFFVIAMREELSRTLKCNEEDAIEHLMQLSPYEVKSLLQQVLIAHDQVENLRISSGNTSPRSKGFTLEEGKQKKETNDAMKIEVRSAGFEAGNFAEIEITRGGGRVNVPLIVGRGLNFVAVDPIDGSIIDFGNYDIFSSDIDSEKFAQSVNSLDEGIIVVLAGKDDFAEKLTESAKAACESLGSNMIRNVHFRDSWCMIGTKGAPKGSVPESYKKSVMGPTEKITHTINLVENGLSSECRRASIATILPSQGRWLRRRRNDGALNRVPLDFYPKVWKVLSKTAAIVVYNATLSSHPTISESTPEELNFALQVENLLDNIVDPAEHQIATECLVVISRIEERNPELSLSGRTINMIDLINEAISQFWDKWISEKSNENVVTPLIHKAPIIHQAVQSVVSTPITKNAPAHNDEDTPISLEAVQTAARRISEVPPKESGLHADFEARPTVTTKAGSDLSYERNQRLARRIFFDLRQDGPQGTMSYLAIACVRHAFGVSWSNSINFSESPQ